jgi:hypothetical protein
VEKRESMFKRAAPAMETLKEIRNQPKNGAQYRTPLRVFVSSRLTQAIKTTLARVLLLRAEARGYCAACISPFVTRMAAKLLAANWGRAKVT